MIPYLLLGLLSLGFVGFMMNRLRDFRVLAIIFIVLTSVPVVGYYTSQATIGSDYELLNGLITNKYQITQNCRTGWSSFQDSFCTEYETREVYDGKTCTGSGKDKTCVSNYHTEYKYKYPWERKWFVEAKALDITWMIDRIDPAGVLAPPIWEKTTIGDPASIYHRYQNLVKAAAESLFHADKQLEEKYKDVIPSYPLELTETWKANRILQVDLNIPDLNKWNIELGKKLGVLGPKYQMNAIIVLVNSKYSDEYSYAVRRAWQGFKKNDAVIFIGTDGTAIEWVNVLSWSKTSEFNINLRNELLENKNFDLAFVLTTLEKNSMFYHRRSMKEFEYLKDDIPFNWIFFSMILTIELLVMGALYYVFGSRNYNF